MTKVHIPEHEWDKQKRKQRFSNKKRDRKRNKMKHDRQLDREDEFTHQDELNRLMEEEFNNR